MAHPSGGSAHPPDADLPAWVPDALETIRTTYEAGMPLFTKEALRHAGQQLKAADVKKGDKVTLMALDGAMVDFVIQTGTVYKAEDPEWEYVTLSDGWTKITGDNRQEPILCCISGPELIEPFALDPCTVYCNLQILHRQGQRNKSTKEIIRIPSRPYDEVAKDFRASQEAWEATDTCKELRSNLLSAKTSPEITKIVGFACGSMSIIVDRPSAERSLFQHALLLTLRDVLNEKKNGNGVTCYAQDPAYTDADKRILEESGITVLEHPEAFLEVDDSTVVLSVAPDAPVREIVADIAQPAAMIWNHLEKGGLVEVDEEWLAMFASSCKTASQSASASREMVRVGIADPVSPRLRRMVRDMYDELEFPDYTKHFGWLGVYVRRSAATSEDKNTDKSFPNDANFEPRAPSSRREHVPRAIG